MQLIPRLSTDTQRAGDKSVALFSFLLSATSLYCEASLKWRLIVENVKYFSPTSIFSHSIPGWQRICYKFASSLFANKGEHFKQQKSTPFSEFNLRLQFIYDCQTLPFLGLLLCTFCQFQLGGIMSYNFQIFELHFRRPGPGSYNVDGSKRSQKRRRT